MENRLRQAIYNNGWEGLGDSNARRFFLSTIGKIDKGQIVNSKEKEKRTITGYMISCTEVNDQKEEIEMDKQMNYKCVTEHSYY